MARGVQSKTNQPLRLGWLITVVLAVVLVVGYFVACMIAQSLDGTRGHWWWLWSYKFEEQGSWFDVARTTAALVAIPGAAVALAITYARHHATERQIEQAAAEARSLEERELARRVNEQYVQAVDQLRDDSAVARIAGMHALDRLAQEQEDLRSIVVDVWCAYLRIKRPSESEQIQADEREVRATCTRLLLSHLDPEHEALYWGQDESIRIDLSRADLTAHWDAQGRRFPDSTRFNGATFGNNARFSDATFGNDVWFNHATFGNSARFRGVTFGNSAWFNHATFGNSAWFNHATFGNNAWFGSATFGNNAWFDCATFGSNIVFHQTTFGNNLRFEHATFGNKVQFARATFGNIVQFGSTKFGNDVTFDRATFGRSVGFNGTTFGTHRPRGDGTWWLHEQPDPDETQNQEDAVPS